MKILSKFTAFSSWGLWAVVMWNSFMVSIEVGRENRKQISDNVVSYNNKQLPLNDWSYQKVRWLNTKHAVWSVRVFFPMKFENILTRFWCMIAQKKGEGGRQGGNYRFHILDTEYWEQLRTTDNGHKTLQWTCWSHYGIHYDTNSLLTK
jgi:hypothetical protein